MLPPCRLRSAGIFFPEERSLYDALLMLVCSQSPLHLEGLYLFAFLAGHSSKGIQKKGIDRHYELVTWWYKGRHNSMKISASPNKGCKDKCIRNQLNSPLPPF